MKATIQQKWVAAKSAELTVLGHKVNHPVLTVGNLVGGTLGLLAVWSGIYSIMHFGLSAALVFALLYALASALVDLFSAFHLALGK
jgi:hypothetical protein